MILKLLPVLIAAMGLGLTAQSAPPTQELAGVYESAGVGPDGQHYKGMVEVVRNDETYRLRWTLTERESYLGVGVVKGDVLAVSYFGGTVGVVLYRIEQGPRLVGEWTAMGADGHVYTETLTLRPDKKPGPEDPQPPSVSEPGAHKTPPVRGRSI